MRFVHTLAGCESVVPNLRFGAAQLDYGQTGVQLG